QGWKNESITDLVRVPGKIRPATGLALLLQRISFVANTLLHQHRNQFAGGEGSFMFKQMIVEEFDILPGDLEIGPVVCGNSNIA
ncbi:MAG TPA: hypothetical protein VFO91_02900, partial [Anaerolineales bacterium]|nr:hypothetical protein [Anaerolineales bacterium]